MYFTPYLVTVQQAEQYRNSEGWLTRPHGNSCRSDRRSDRRSIPIHECTRWPGTAELAAVQPTVHVDLNVT